LNQADEKYADSIFIEFRPMSHLSLTVFIVFIETLLIFLLIGGVLSKDLKVINPTSLFLVIIVALMFSAYRISMRSLLNISMNAESVQITRVKDKQSLNWDQILGVKYMKTTAGGILFWLTVLKGESKTTVFFMGSFPEWPLEEQDSFTVFINELKKRTKIKEIFHL